jgi:hypothetical protein
MTTGLHARETAAIPLDLAKHDRTISLGDRAFAVRAYLDRRAPDGPGWHAVIIENRTPVNHELVPTDDPEECFAAAVRFLTTTIATDASDRKGAEEWESEGGALHHGVDRGLFSQLGTEGRAAS